MDTALPTIVHTVEESTPYKEVVLAMIFDIEGAFDSAKTATIYKALHTRAVRTTLVSLRERLWQLRRRVNSQIAY